jgi:hypothetical protein
VIRRRNAFTSIMSDLHHMPLAITQKVSSWRA